MKIYKNSQLGSSYKNHVGLLTINSKEPPPVKLSDPDRPLIDQLQEATFGDSTSMQWVTDKYALRMLLRKAHCFTIDEETSAMVSDFSIAISNDLEASRHLAIPPFPVTWFELDNWARMRRLKELGIRLTKVAANQDDLIPRVGWLIVHGTKGYSASYVAKFDTGIFVAPSSFHWTIDETHCSTAPIKIDGKSITDEAPKNVIDRLQELSNNICFGMQNSNTNFYTTNFGPASFQGDRFGKYEFKIMEELWGELRHIWGLLIALGTATAEIGEPTKHQGPPPIMKGKPLLAIEHKTLKIHLGKKKTVKVIVAKALFGVRKRWHEVRAHTRLLPSGKRVPIKSHERGDERLGKIIKTYKVEK